MRSITGGEMRSITGGEATRSRPSATLCRGVRERRTTSALAGAAPRLVLLLALTGLSAHAPGGRADA